MAAQSDEVTGSGAIDDRSAMKGTCAEEARAGLYKMQANMIQPQCHQKPISWLSADDKQDLANYHGCSE